MAHDSRISQKRAVIQHITEAHDMKGKLFKRRTESLATNNRLVKTTSRTLSSEPQQAVLARLLGYLCAPFAARQETHITESPIISIEDYTIYCSDADEKKKRSCTITARNDYNNVVEEFGSMSSRDVFVRLQDSRGRNL
ncbi:hypothetical protein RB195_023109 [Necator americanus]|uniref:Uncharacterized protein n=1 Tax=Necator americanus TaxID=51031 RepID=A0ABR1EHV6_NECAM